MDSENPQFSRPSLPIAGCLPLIISLKVALNPADLPNDRTMMYMRPIPCSKPVKNASSGLTFVRRASTWQIEATVMLSSHNTFNGLAMARSAGAKRNCLIANDIAALWTGRWPKRVIAARKSVNGFPEGLNEAELATWISRAANWGSVLTIFIICVTFASGSDSALRTRITTSGNDGKLTLPADTSAARSFRSCIATARSSLGGGFAASGAGLFAGFLADGAAWNIIWSRWAKGDRAWFLVLSEQAFGGPGEFLTNISRICPVIPALTSRPRHGCGA